MKRKSTPKKRPAAHPPLKEEQERLVAQLLQGIQNNSGPADIVRRVPDSLCAQRLIERLPSGDDVIPLLLALKERFHEKSVSKAIRRAVFKLDRKGVSTDAFHTEDAMTSTILKPPEKEGPLCYVGPVNGAGTRAVVLILHRRGKGLDTGFGVVSDTEGIREFFFRTVSRKDAKELRKQFEEEAGPFVETSLAHAATILEAAYQRQQAIKSSAPADYLELRPWLLETTHLLERPIVYDLIPESVTSGYVLTDAAIRDLFDDPLMESWLIEPGAVKPFIKDMYQVNESPIVLTQVQRAARIREIKDKCLAKIFTAEERERLKGRLEEMGYMFLKLGQEETAKLALAAAQTVDQEVTVLRTNPVIETLLQRSLALYKDAVGERFREHAPGKMDDPSPIILP